MPGMLGHFGPTLNNERNELVIKANKLVDEYNKNVGNFSTHDEQFNYQKDMLIEINNTLNGVNDFTEIEEAATEWVFDTNGHKWSNNDDTAGDNYGSFINGAKSDAAKNYWFKQFNK